VGQEKKELGGCVRQKNINRGTHIDCFAGQNESSGNGNVNVNEFRTF